jgi:saposin
MKAILIIFGVLLFSSCFYTAQAQSTECQACQTILGTIETWVENNATEAQIQTYLQALCSNVPDFAAVCDIVIDYGLPYVISYIQNDGNPDTLCTLLGLCSSEKECGQLRSGSECFVCQEVISTVESWLAAQVSEEEIEGLFNTLCNYIPGWQQQCDAVIAAGWPAVIQWINENENSTAVCGELNLCTEGCAEMEEMNVEGTELECKACQVVVNTVEDWLSENATESTIENDLMNVFCSIGGAFTATCDQIFAYGVPTFVNWLDANENGDAFCAQVSICTSAVKVVVPINKAVPVKMAKFSNVKIN